MHVCVDADPRLGESLGENEVRCLSPHALEGEERVEIIRYTAIVMFHKHVTEI